MMFENTDVTKLSEKELEDKLLYLGRIYGIKIVQTKQHLKTMDSAREKYTRLNIEKYSVLRDIEIIGVEMERRRASPDLDPYEKKSSRMKC